MYICAYTRTGVGEGLLLWSDPQTDKYETALETEEITLAVKLLRFNLSF